MLPKVKIVQIFTLRCCDLDSPKSEAARSRFNEIAFRQEKERERGREMGRHLHSHPCRVLLKSSVFQKISTVLFGNTLHVSFFKKMLPCVCVSSRRMNF